MEFEIEALTNDGKMSKFNLSDDVIDYFEMRSKFSEEVCIEVIENIKRRSGKKCAILFGNCQTIRLRNIFLNHIEFSKEYFFLILPTVYEYKNTMAELLYGGGGHFLEHAICLLVNM